VNEEPAAAPIAVPAKQPRHTVEVNSTEWQYKPDWPNGLKSADDAARDLGISSRRLQGLADGGFAPHYRIEAARRNFA
jgi:hypothetical protein